MSCNKLIRVKPLLTRLSATNGRSLIGNQCSRRHYWPARRHALWDPFSEVQRSVDRIWRDFDRFTPLFPRILGNSRSVPVETNVDGQRVYKIEIDLPDFKPEDINVSIKDGVVSITAKREFESDGCKQSREYQYQYSLPAEANIEKIRSLIDGNGLLTIEAPLPAVKEPELKEIPIKKG